MNWNNWTRAVITSLITSALLISTTGCSVFEDRRAVKSDAVILSEVHTQLELVAPIVKRSAIDLWWISPDGYSIINDGSAGVEAQFPGCVNDDANYSMWKSVATKAVTAVDKVLLTAGFSVESKMNSSNDLADTKYYDYIRAYYRGTTKAVLSISPDCGSTMSTDHPVMYYSASFGFTDNFQRNYDAQSPFLIDLQLKDVIVHIQKSVGEYRLLAINYRRSGHATIVKKVDGKWREMWSGQDLISCAVRESKKIPLSMAPDCYKS